MPSAGKEQVRNPQTGRWINVGGPTFERLRAKGYDMTQQETRSARKTGRKAKPKQKTANAQKNYFRSNAQMVDKKHKAYCRCVAHVAADQSDDCLRDLHDGYRPTDDKDCYNPHAVCTKSTGRRGPGSGECMQHYNLQHVPMNERRALALLKLGTTHADALHQLQKCINCKK